MKFDLGGLFHFIEKAKRILILARKPTKEEFMLTVKVNLLGIFALGLVGMVVILLTHYLGV